MEGIRHLRLAELVQRAYSEHSHSINEIEFLVLPDASNTVVVLFRGTELRHIEDDSYPERIQDYWDVIRDLRLLPWRDSRIGWGPAGFVRGADKAVEVLRKELRDQHRIIIAGHSLGGALALLVGLDLLVEGYPVTQITTFGAPHCFYWQSRASKRVIRESGAEITHYRNGCDLVTYVPPGRIPGGYTKIGKRAIRPCILNHPISKYIRSLRDATNSPRKK